jgi:hypothetical protein
MHHLRRFASFLVIFFAFTFADLSIGNPTALGGNEVPVVAALCDALEAQLGVRPVYRRVKKAKDGTITIRGLTTEVKEAAAAKRRIKGTLSIERVSLAGINKDADGLLDVAEAKLVNLIFITDEEGEASSALRLPEVTITHLVLKPAPGQLVGGAAILPFGLKAQSFIAANGVLSSGGISLEIGSLQASWQGDPETGVGRTDLRIEDVHYPVTLISRSDPSGVVLSLIGGGDLIFDLWGTANATNAGGSFEAAISARSLGRLKLAGSFAGPSLGALASAPSASQSDATIAAPTASGFMLSRLSLRYEDQSLTGKLLAMLAKERGVERDKLISDAATAVEAALTGIDNQTFIDQLKTAIQFYLSEPRSFTLTSQEPQPVPAGAFVESIAEGPSGFFSQFPASVTVND